MPSRWSDVPGGATHFGSGFAAHGGPARRRFGNALLTIERDAIVGGGGRHPIEGLAHVGAHRLPWR